MTALSLGVLIGFWMCVPVGPINIIVLNKSIQQNFLSALSIGLGSSLMDIIYFFILTMGLSIFSLNDTFTFYYQVIGVILLVFLGLKEFFQKPKLNKSKKDVNAQTLIAHFVFGCLLYISNPTYFITLTSIILFVRSGEWLGNTLPENALFSIGTGLGSALWFCFLVGSVFKFRHRFSEKIMNYIAKSSGVLILILAILMIWNFLKK